MKYWEPLELARFAFEKSAFYQELYSNVDWNCIQFNELPVVNQENFWKANQWRGNRLLTSKPDNGIIFKTGGTTGHPKSSVYTNEEWEAFTRIFGEGMAVANLKEGERVGNLFLAGGLYASFPFIMKSLEKSSVPVLQSPISGQTEFSEVVNIIREFDVTTLAGVPTLFMNMANRCLEKKIDLPLKKILYGGEALFDDQRVFLEKVFPGVEIHSIGYASVDGGHLGFRGADCRGGEHDVFLGSSLMELIDPESGELIECREKRGKLVYTNLARSLMPIIRYPVGDEAEWVEPGKRFVLRGRVEESASVGPISISRDDLVNVLHRTSFHQNISNFQMVLDSPKNRDRLVVRLAGQVEDTTSALREVTKLFYEQKPLYKEMVELDCVDQVLFEWLQANQLERNARTGKLKFLIDNRKSSSMG